MQEGIKVYVGLDVHKDSIAVGVAEAGRTPGRVIGQCMHDVNKLLKMLVKLGAAQVQTAADTALTSQMLRARPMAVAASQNTAPSTARTRAAISMGRGVDKARNRSSLGLA